jgi:hypothetical protein
MNCESKSSENLERRIGGGVAYIRELPASEGDSAAVQIRV